ncbi:hypothetical protein BDAP_002217 [Binucleata daphniae]
MKHIQWERTELVGAKERIYEVCDMQYIKLYKCVNNIVVGLIKESNYNYNFLQTKMNKKIKKNTEFMSIQNQKTCLPFNCKIIELVEYDWYNEYCFIVLMT